MSNQEWNEFYFLWRHEGASIEHPAGIHCDDYPLYETPAAEALLKERAQSYGTLPSISAYIRAFAALKQEGAIRQVRSIDPLKIAEPVVTKESYERMSAAEVRHRYATDREWRAGLDHLLATGQI